MPTDSYTFPYTRRDSPRVVPDHALGVRSGALNMAATHAVVRGADDVRILSACAVTTVMTDLLMNDHARLELLQQVHRCV